MKIDRLVWGILFLFVGSVLLLDNFDIITFYWRNVWQFWPVILIIIGVNVMLGKKESNIGGIITLSVLVVTLCYLFYRGQQEPRHRNWFSDNMNARFDFDDDNNDNRNRGEKINFGEPFNSAEVKNAVLNVYGGGTSIDLDGATDSLVAGLVHRRYGNFTFEKELRDSAYELTLRLQDKKGRFSVSNGGNDVDLKLNTAPEWDFNMHLGAGALDLDLSNYKVKNFNFDGGAASVDVKLGDLLPVTHVNVKTGVADVKIQIPAGSGCQIRTNTGLSSKDFEGFIKIGNGLYESPNFKSSNKTIYIKLDGGLSNFEVHKY